MDEHVDDPEIIFSNYTQSVVIDGHHIDPGWILSVENQFRTLTVSDDPPFFGDVLAWRAFEKLVRKEGIRAFYNKKERRKLGL